VRGRPGVSARSIWHCRSALSPKIGIRDGVPEAGICYICHIQTDPQAALSQVASRQEIGLVLSDLYMPGLTGLQFINRLYGLRLSRALSPRWTRLVANGLSERVLNPPSTHGNLRQPLTLSPQ
jgi:hypothetical protein